MARFEKIGNYLLFEKIDEDKLAVNYLAGQISGNQIQQICVVKKFEQLLAAAPVFIQELNREYEAIKGISNPNIVKPNVFIHDKKDFAAVFDYVEGRSLRNVLNRCSQDGFPFSVDHSLLVASRLCTALEYLHSKKVNDQKMVHGYVSPEAILVTYDGEIRLQYLGLAHALLKHPSGREKLFLDYKNYLAPEFVSQQKWDKAIDIYSTGLVLFEMLTGEPLDKSLNVQSAINNAEMFSNSGDRVPVSDDLKKLLHQALAQEPAQRFASIADMRKALDLILFSSEFSPTTFNLAFFMHSIFREQIDEENKSINLYKKTDPAPYLKEEPAPAPAAPAPKPQVQTHQQHQPAPAAQVKKEPSHPPASPRPERAQPAAPVPVPAEMFGTSDEKEKSKAPLFVAILLVLAVAGALIYFFLLKPVPAQQTKQPPVQQQPQTPTLTPEQLQAQEAERKRLEEEAMKAQEEAKKKDEELKALQAKLDALMKAQLEEAKKQKESKEAALKEQADLAAIKKLQEEARKLEEERKQQQLLAEQKLKEAQTPPVTQPAQQQAVEQVASTNNPPLPAPTDGSTQQPAGQQQEPAPQIQEPAAPQVVEGMIVDLTPDVVKPEIVKRVNPNYPHVAQQKKVEGTVILSVLVSERGEVIEAKVLRAAGGTSGLNEAAVEAVRKWKFRPAVKEGKRVKVWMTYPIVFKLQ